MTCIYTHGDKATTTAEVHLSQLKIINLKKLKQHKRHLKNMKLYWAYCLNLANNFAVVPNSTCCKTVSDAN